MEATQETQEQRVLNIQKQCQEQKIAFFFKQWGAYRSDGKRMSKKENGAKPKEKECRTYTSLKHN